MVGRIVADWVVLISADSIVRTRLPNQIRFGRPNRIRCYSKGRTTDVRPNRRLFGPDFTPKVVGLMFGRIGADSVVLSGAESVVRTSLPKRIRFGRPNRI